MVQSPLQPTPSGLQAQQFNHPNQHHAIGGHAALHAFLTEHPDAYSDVVQTTLQKTRRTGTDLTLDSQARYPVHMNLAGCHVFRRTWFTTSPISEFEETEGKQLEKKRCSARGYQTFTKMCETFVWNLKDLVVTPEHFAQILVEDYNLCYLALTYHQTSDFKAHTVNYDGDEDEAGDTRHGGQQDLG
ncbi:hypothetical protein F5887DRAFT_1076647 [Amanita rubescens]|nr:hypothetical protein F5887DRAFT_1076647 [Amanita rubescens]